jgi:hypothetical protein
MLLLILDEAYLTFLPGIPVNPAVKVSKNILSAG